MDMKHFLIKFNLAAILLLTLTLVGCGKFESMATNVPAGDSNSNSLARKPYGTCDRKDVTSINLCMEAVGPDYNEPGYLSILQSSCESSGGLFSTGLCDASQGLGTCAVSAGMSNATYISYYSPQYTTQSAQAACDIAGGVFFPTTP